MTSATGGDALIGGRSVRTQLADIRRSLSYCPQYDCVYRHLSVREHMRFYGMLRALHSHEVRFKNN